MSNSNADLAELANAGGLLPGQGAGINIRRLLRLRGPIMLGIFLAIAVPAAIVVWMLVPRQIVAEASITFKANAPRILDDQQRMSAGTSAYEAYVNTEISRLTGWSVLNHVAAEAEVRALPSSIERGQAGVVRYIRRNLALDMKSLSEIATVTYKDVDQADAQLILTRILARYEHELKEEELRQRENRTQTLTEKERELTEELEQLRVEMAEKRRQLEVPVGQMPGVEPTETESYRVNLAQAQADISRTQSAQRTTEKLIERLRKYQEEQDKDPAKPIFGFGIEDRVNLNPNVTMLAQQLAAVQQQYSVVEGTYVDGAPQVSVKRHEMQAVQAKLDQVRATTRTAVIRALVSEHETELESHKAATADAEERGATFASLLEEYRKKNVELAKGLAEVQDLEQRALDTRAYLRQITDQLLNQQLESNAPARVVIGPVTSEGTPDIKQRLKYLLAAIFLALGASIGIGLLLELSDQNIRSAEDVAYVSHHPILGNVPHSAEDRLPAQLNVARVAADHRSSMTADEIRRIAARILHSGHRGRETKTCVVASPARGDGKSTLACNLAIVLAQAERKVLLVDVDSRNPSIEPLFGLPFGPGLGEMLAGEPLEHDPDRATDFDNLYVIGPGLNADDLVERLASREISDFLQGAEEIFDHIIIDTPASLLMSEARILAPLADGVLIVVGAGVSSFGMLRRALRAIEEAGGNILGLVVNGLRQSPGGYLRQNIELFYEQRNRTPKHMGPPPKARRREAPSVVLVKDNDGRD